MLKELALFGVGVAVGAAGVYYVSETVNDNIRESRDNLEFLLNNAPELERRILKIAAEQDNKTITIPNSQVAVVG